MDRVVVGADAVVRSLNILRALRLHRTFSGYLAVKWHAASEGSEQGLAVDFKGFFDKFLRVPGGPEGKPYAVPFVELPASAENEWLNKNLAGSYAPSSLREASPFRQVIKIEGQGRACRYSLRAQHGHLAFRHLAYSNRIPVIPLAVFLFRDYAIEMVGANASSMVELFRQEFGYESTNGSLGDAYDVLFQDDTMSSEDLSFDSIRPEAQS